MKLDCERNELTGRITCEEIDPDTLKRAARHSDADDGKWRVAPQRPWPPSNLAIKSWVLVGLAGDATAVALDRVEGGAGLPHPSPLVLTFAAGWDSQLTKLVEKWKDREELDGTIYYVTSRGRAVAKLTFEKAVVAMIKWPKLAKKGKRADKDAKLTVVLQPSHTVVEKIEEAADAPDAPDPNTDKLHAAKCRDFKIDIDNIDTSSVSGVSLPNIVMKLKRRIRYAFEPDASGRGGGKQVRRVAYKVTGVRPKHLTLYFPKDDKAATKPFKEWKADLHPRARIGTVELQQKSGEGEGEGEHPLITVKFFGMFVNRIGTKADRVEVEIAFDKMEVEHHSLES